MFSFPLSLYLFSHFFFFWVNRDDFRFMADHTHAHVSHTCTHTFAYLINAFYPFGLLTFCLCAISIDFRLSLIGKACQKCWPAPPPFPYTVTLSLVCQLIAWLKNLINLLDWSPPPRLLLLPCALAIPASCLFLLVRIIYASIVISCFHFLSSACLCIGVDLSFLELGQVRSFIYSLIAIRQWPLAKSLHIR